MILPDPRVGCCRKKEGFRCGSIMVHRVSFSTEGDGILARVPTLKSMIYQESGQILG